jgi:hypothetical protein
MNKLFFGGGALAALAAFPALAQPGGEGGGRFAQPQTRAAVEAQVQARFERADANRDGFVAQDEIRARREAGEARSGGRRGMTGGFGGRGFAAMDLDHDGRVALAEANRAALERFDRIDSNRDGTISPDERQAARAARQERMQERQGN